MPNIYGASECSVIMIGRMMATPRSCIGRATGELTDPNDHDRLVPIGAIGGLVRLRPWLEDTWLTRNELMPCTSRILAGVPATVSVGNFTRPATLLVARIFKSRSVASGWNSLRSRLICVLSTNTMKTAIAMLHPGGKSMLAAFMSSHSVFGPEFAHPFHAPPKD